MNYGLYLSAMGVLANMHKQDVASNNLANVSTDGFKRSLASFEVRQPESIEDGSADLRHGLLDRIGGGIQIAPSQVDLGQGSLKNTGRPLDLGIKGSGYFAVNPKGSSAEIQQLTRDGRLTIGAGGNLVTIAGGHQMLDKAGVPIQIDTTAGPLTIDQRGAIKQNGAVVAELRFLDIKTDDPGALRPVGAGLFSVKPEVLAEATPATQGQIEQNHLETSNVDPIKELMRLIGATKAVSSNGNMIRYHDMVMDRAVNVLGRVS